MSENKIDDAGERRIVMVMGVQRSGTNALFNSFASDGSLRCFNESDDDDIYFDWNLRPEPTIRRILRGTQPVLLKPVNETDVRNVLDVIREYADYDLWIPWIYRDPVNVFFSWWRKWSGPPVGEFIEMWNRRNRSVLTARFAFESKIGIMKYEDLVRDESVFKRACEFFRISGKSLFHEDSQSGRKSLRGDVIAQIERGTTDVVAELDKKRNFV